MPETTHTQTGLAQFNTEPTTEHPHPTPEETEDLSNGEVYETLRTGDKIMWDAIENPVTVGTGYVDYTESEGEEPSILMLTGPRGGEKTLVQNKHNSDVLYVGALTRSSTQRKIKNLRVVERA